MDYDKAIESAKDHGRIILPDLIHSDEYEQVMNLLMIARHHNNSRLELYIAGFGGHTDLVFGIISWIKNDWLHESGIDGHLIGAAYSCHAAIWAACPYRYFYKNSFLGVHPTKSKLETFDQFSGANEVKTLKQYDELIIDLYTEASNKSADWWRKQYVGISNGVRAFNAVELLKLEMGEML